MAKSPTDDEAWKVADRHRLVPPTTESVSEPSAVARVHSSSPGGLRAIKVALIGGALAIIAAALVWFPREQESPALVSQPEPVSTTDDAAVAEVAPSPATRAQAVRARRALASLLRERALGRGDSLELDDALDRLGAAFEGEHWTHACAQAEAATAVVNEMVISGPMVRARLGRAERRAERAEDSMVRERLEVGILEGRALLDEGELEAANRRLFDAMAGTVGREVAGGATPAAESDAP